MSAIDEYEAEYRSHVQAAEEKLAVVDHSGPHSDSGRSALNAAERAAEAAKDVVQLMELEGRSLPGPSRSGMQSMMRACRDELSLLKARLKELRSARTPQQADRIREDLRFQSAVFSATMAALCRRLEGHGDGPGVRHNTQLDYHAC